MGRNCKSFRTVLTFFYTDPIMLSKTTFTPSYVKESEESTTEYRHISKINIESLKIMSFQKSSKLLKIFTIQKMNMKGLSRRRVFVLFLL